MRYIKKFNESKLKTKEIINNILDCLVYFFDNGWVDSGKYDIDHFAHRDTIFVKITDADYEYEPTSIRDYINYRGESKSGKIIFDKEVFEDCDRNRLDETDELKDFLTAINRINDMIDIDFTFSYDNIGGGKRIKIQGI